MTDKIYKKYLDTLAPLFVSQNVHPLNLACTLLRASDNEAEGWDSLQESREILDDLINLNQLNLDEGNLHRGARRSAVDVLDG